MDRCYGSNILVAFDTAVADDVDVVSLSVGGVVVSYHLDKIAIGAFGTNSAGMFVCSSAGNGSLGGLTVTNVAPWVTTIGAGTIDRDFSVLLSVARLLFASQICVIYNI
ncbi:hypothetical protein V8G54_031710 [Vigna mungo]|uniref:Peptidase S8/S53 domain-containing protein n=1 Tax=Vigna mungo TaxID=3915 RepID=A0AAQ3RH65_VIGMU